MYDIIKWNKNESLRRNISVNALNLGMITMFFFAITRFMLHLFMTRVYLNRHAAAEMLSFTILMVLQITFLMNDSTVFYVWSLTTYLLVVGIVLHQIILWIKIPFVTQIFYFTVALLAKYYYLYMSRLIFGMWMVAIGIISGFCLGYIVLRIPFIGRMVGLPEDPICQVRTNLDQMAENQEAAPAADDNPNVPEAQGENLWGGNN